MCLNLKLKIDNRAEESAQVMTMMRGRIRASSLENIFSSRKVVIKGAFEQGA